MRKKLARISPVRTAWTMALVYFVIAVIAWIIFAITSLSVDFAPQGQMLWPLLGSLIAVVIYPIAAFIGFLITAWIYNLVARWTGGIEFTLKDTKKG